jgi:hypothetical protein
VPEPKRWSDLTANQQRLVCLGVLLETVMTTVAIRDLTRRPPAQVRGRKPLWALSFAVQPFGPIAYLALGRR